MGIIGYFQRARTNKLLADQNSILQTGMTSRQAETERTTRDWQSTPKGRTSYERNMRFWKRMSDRHPEPEFTQKLRDLATENAHHHILVAVFEDLIAERTSAQRPEP